MYDIFLSYRRDGGHEMARFLYEHFCARGLKCFFDLEELGAGEFNVKLLDCIEDSKNFVLILSPHSLDRCKNEGDWVRSEIEHAIKKGKNIVPLMLSGFEWPKDLPESLEKLPFYNGVMLVREYFDASLAKLIGLLSLDRATKAKAKKASVAETSKAGAASWLERAFVFLEDEEWEKADAYAEKVLDVEPKNGEAYLVKLMALLRVDKRENLKNVEELFVQAPPYKTLMRYADEALKAEIAGYIEHIRAVQAQKTEDAYQQALVALNSARTETECKNAARAFAALGAYKDSEEKMKESYKAKYLIERREKYSCALALEKKKTAEEREEAWRIFVELGNYKDSAERAKKYETRQIRKNMRIVALVFAAIVVICLVLGIGLRQSKSGSETSPFKYELLNDGTYSLLEVSEVQDGGELSLPAMYKGKAVTSIGDEAFANCAEITSITIPDGVKSIGDSAFAGCANLATITLPNSLESIGDSAFKGCRAVSHIALPHGITHIGKAAFAECPKLYAIDFDGTKAAWQAVSKDAGWKGAFSIAVYCTDGALIE